MRILAKLEEIHHQVRQNTWLHYFAIFNRLVLAAGFIPAGITKVLGERFASGLSVLHPMGHYLEALHFTGFYYTFIGIAQITTGVFLLIPRTVPLGALLYFPIILNICILSFAVRFDGSLLTSPLMLLANLYLLCWHFDRIKFILPFKKADFQYAHSEIKPSDKNFPIKFFTGVFISIVLVFVLVVSMNKYVIMPRNSFKDCMFQFQKSKNEKAGRDFCNCIHIEGKSLNACLKYYDERITDSN